MPSCSPGKKKAFGKAKYSIESSVSDSLRCEKSRPYFLLISDCTYVA